MHIAAPFIGSLDINLWSLLGLDNGGLRAFVLAIFIAGGLSATLSLTLRKHPVGRIVPAFAGVAAARYGAYLLVSGMSAMLGSSADHMSAYVSFSVGPGFWAFLGGGVVMIFGSTLPRDSGI
jgi:hypothetical protein